MLSPQAGTHDPPHGERKKVFPLIGPKTLKQLDDYLPVMDMKLNKSIIKKCDLLVPPGSARANFHNSAPWMKMQLEW